MPEQSAGILLYRRDPAGLSVLLVHPGGPFWRHRDAGAWQIPKGKIDPGEDPPTAALREVAEELGVVITAPLLELGKIRQAGGKTVQVYAAQQDLDADAIVSNLFEMEWPRGSGTTARFPEVDAARWVTIDQARELMLQSQQPLIDLLHRALDER